MCFALRSTRGASWEERKSFVDRPSPSLRTHFRAEERVGRGVVWERVLRRVVVEIV